MKLIIIALMVGTGSGLHPDHSDTLSLEYCYERIQEHHPLAQKAELQKEITDLNVRIANTGYYPQLGLSGSASYQSEVTTIPSGPGGAAFPGISKDQYQVSIDINQPIYNGGAVGIRKNMEREQGRQEQLSTEVQLQEVRSQVDEVYFNILLAQQQSHTNDLMIKSLRSQLETVSSKVKNGVLLASQQYILEAELIRARQDSSEIQSNITAGYEILGELTGKKISTNAVLEIPEIRYEPLLHSRSGRPEWGLFRSSKNLLEYQKELASAKKLPQISAFGALAYGRPGYNFLNDEFHEFYRVGVRVRWNFWDWNNSAAEQKAIAIRQQKIDEDQQAFSRQLSAALSQIDQRIVLLQDQIQRDKEIIELRKRVLGESASQLEKGIITATEYITELTNANQAQLSHYARQVQLARMKIQYATTKGIPVFGLKQVHN